MHPDGRPTKYAPAGAFARDVRRRVTAHFAGRSRVDDTRMHRKAAVILLWWTASYLHLLFFAAGWWDGALAVVSLAFASAAVPMAISHDGGHLAFSGRPWLNSCAAWAMNLLGMSTPWWRRKHGTLHHGFTRLDGLDDDLEQGLLFRMHPDQPLRPWHRWQHVYALALYPFLHLAMVVTGIRFLLTGRVGHHQFAPPPPGERALGLGATAACFALLFGLPCLVREPWMVAIALVCGSGMFALILALIFQAEHCVGEVESPVRDPASGLIDRDWVTSQVLATQGFAHDNRALSWYSGGLNLHVEHHLFPRTSHTHYRELSVVVAEVCEHHGVPYRVVPTFGEAIAAHFRWLRVLGQPEAARAVGASPRPPASSATSLPSGA